MSIHASTGTQASIQSIHDAAGTVAGDIITIPDGSYTWTTGSTLNITKAISVQAANMPADARVTPSNVNVTMNASGGTYLVTLNVPNSGNCTLAGINFLPGNCPPNSTFAYVHTTGGPKGQGGSSVCLMNNCTFNVPDFVLLHAVEWFSTGGVVWKCHFFGSTVNAEGIFNGSGSGCFYAEGNIGWWVQDNFGTFDTTGTGNLYLEDCLFDGLWNQATDFGDNGRCAIRNCTFNNSQGLTHGSTSNSGGRAIELYNNNFNYFPTNATFSNGQFQECSASGQTPNNGGKWPPMSRWFWWRAGTARIHDNTCQQIYSFGYYGQVPAWSFIDETLTRAQNNSINVCELDTAYPGWHWCGTGGNVLPANDANFSFTTNYRTYEIVDPVYVWNNTYTFNPSSGTSGSVLSAANQWGPSDQSGATATCGAAVIGVNSTRDVFLINRDIVLTSPPAGAGGVPGTYAPYPYPHPLTSATAFSPPTVPSGLTATATSSTSITLGWTQSTDTGTGMQGLPQSQIQYPIEHKAGAGSFTQIAGTPVTGVGTFIDSPLSPSTVYGYQLRSEDSQGNISAYFPTPPATVTATTLAQDSTAPTTPSPTIGSITSNSMTVSWLSSTDVDNNSTVLTYTIQRQTNGGAFSVLQSGIPGVATGSQVVYPDSGLSPSTTYGYQVESLDPSANTNGFSATVSASTSSSGTGNPSIIQTTSVSYQAPTASLTATYPLAQTPGDSNVIVVGWRDSTSTIASVLDTSGNLYTPVTGTTVSGGISQAIYVASNIAIGSLYTRQLVGIGSSQAFGSVAVSQASAGNSYTTTFPNTENPISEGGQWISAGTVTGNKWCNVRTNGGTPGLAWTTEVDTQSPSFSQFADATAIMSGTWGPNQTVTVKVVTGSQNTGAVEEIEMRLHTTITSNSITGYEILFRNINASTGGTGYADIVRWNGPLGSFTTIAMENGSYNGIHNGDILMATITSAGLITSYVNGTIVCQGTDTTYPGGSPGIGFDLTNGTGTGNATWGFSSFTATDH